MIVNNPNSPYMGSLPTLSSVSEYPYSLAYPDSIEDSKIDSVETKISRPFEECGTSHEVEYWFITRYPFTAEDSQELSLSTGELLRVLEDVGDGWVYVKNGQGNVGYVPRDFILQTNSPIFPDDDTSKSLAMPLITEKVVANNRLAEDGESKPPSRPPTGTSTSSKVSSVFPKPVHSVDDDYDYTKLYPDARGSLIISPKMFSRTQRGSVVMTCHSSLPSGSSLPNIIKNEYPFIDIVNGDKQYFHEIDVPIEKRRSVNANDFSSFNYSRSHIDKSLNEEHSTTVEDSAIRRQADNELMIDSAYLVDQGSEKYSQPLTAILNPEKSSGVGSNDVNAAIDAAIMVDRTRSDSSNLPYYSRRFSSFITVEDDKDFPWIAPVNNQIPAYKVASTATPTVKSQLSSHSTSSDRPLTSERPKLAFNDGDLSPDRRSFSVRMQSLHPTNMSSSPNALSGRPRLRIPSSTTHLKQSSLSTYIGQVNERLSKSVRGHRRSFLFPPTAVAEDGGRGTAVDMSTQTALTLASTSVASGGDWPDELNVNMKKTVLSKVDSPKREKEVTYVMRQNDEWFSGMMSEQKDSFQSLAASVDNATTSVTETLDAVKALVRKIGSFKLPCGDRILDSGPNGPHTDP